MMKRRLGPWLALVSLLLAACTPVPLTSLLRPCPEDEINELLSTLPSSPRTPLSQGAEGPATEGEGRKAQ